MHGAKNTRGPRQTAGSSELIAPARSVHLGSALGVTRTLNLLIRSQMLYPLSYERLCREMSVVVGREMPRSESLSSDRRPYASMFRSPAVGPRRRAGVVRIHAVSCRRMRARSCDGKD